MSHFIRYNSNKTKDLEGNDSQDSQIIQKFEEREQNKHKTYITGFFFSC